MGSIATTTHKQEGSVVFDLEAARTDMNKNIETSRQQNHNKRTQRAHSSLTPTTDDTFPCSRASQHEHDAEGGMDHHSDRDGRQHHPLAVKTCATHAGSDNISDSDTMSSLMKSAIRANTTRLLVTLILVLGFATSAAFAWVGLSGVMSDDTEDFQRYANDAIAKIESSFDDYANAASLVHARCRHRNFTRADFRELYEYLVASGLEVKAVQFDPNISHAERPTAEAEARQFYAKNYPYVDYQGFRGFNTLNSTSLQPRTNESFYFPIHYMEPIEGNEAAIDLDYHSSETRLRALYGVFDNKAPSMTDRLKLVKKLGQVNRCGNIDGASYGVVLMHPGIEVSNPTDVWPRDISSIVLCITDLMTKSIQNPSHASSVYIHDRSHPGGRPAFLGGAKVLPAISNSEIEFLDEIELDVLNDDLRGLYEQRNIIAANRVWTITVTNDEGRYDSGVVFVALGAFIILLSSTALVFWLRHNEKRNHKFNKEREASEQEKAALILENARQATKSERELNDFIAHEVRNPVAAAMAACNFVKTAIHKEDPLRDAESLEMARDDVKIIDNALHFVNDLLRTMLDMHRASSKQLHVAMAPVDLLHDVLEPVGGMLYQRGSKVELKIECPRNLIIHADCLRLKQVVLNLGRNSSKFIQEGFIRLKAEEVDGSVKIYVDDSGCGIPAEKRQLLFAKFQESLDVLSQGTGIGLFLCEKLVKLMGGKIYLDDDYDSGISGYPGTRFVIDMCADSISPTILNISERADTEAVKSVVAQFAKDEDSGDDSSTPAELPENLSVLFVDDDSVLRKLFSRALRRIRPNWNIREAANGETALRLVETETFDLIFMDMYMASVEKQLLGTESVAALRSQGVTSRICGLSANDIEEEFYFAGADSFMFKPFPCEEASMTNALRRILFEDDPRSGFRASLS